MFKKKEVYSHITPIPSHVPRQLAIDILHSHSEIITLNPLVTGHKAIKAPRDAPADEFYSTWYEITERIQYIPGTGKLGSGNISFRGCFHDMPWGLQTHIYAPMNIDMRNNWRIAGNQPGEPPEPRELGLGAPADGLYLREDIEIKCNITLVSFVKAQMKAASKVLVDRLIKKAELLDSGALLALFENGRLKTINPADRTNTVDQNGLPQPPMSPMSSPYHSIVLPNHHYRPSQPGPYSGYPSPPPGNPPGVELPGDYYHDPRYSQDSSYLHPQSSPHAGYSPHAGHASYHSDYSGSSQPDHGRWSGQYQGQTASRPISYSTDGGMQSPSFHIVDQKNYPRTHELPAMAETREDREEPQPPPVPSKDMN